MPAYFQDLLAAIGTFSERPATDAVTFGQLGNLAARYARALSVGTGTPEQHAVAILSDGSDPSLFAAVLGAWMAGRAVLPVHSGESPERMQKIAEAFGLGRFYFVGDAARWERARQACRVPLEILQPDAGASSSFSGPDPSAIAYYIYTSGTVGAPKTVAVSHENLDEWYRASRPEVLPFPPDAHLLNAYGWSFDAWFAQFLWGLPAGVPVFPFGVAEMLRRSEKISGLTSLVLAVTPSQARALLALPEIPLRSSAVLQTFFGGEILDADLAKAWRARFPRTTILNSYGPSETTCTIFHHKIRPGDPLPGSGPIPIGQPHPGVLTAVDENNVLWVSTRQITRGCGEPPPAWLGGAPALWYQTGDLVSTDPAGVFTVIGRIDRQTKVAGRRVLLGEIESAFRAAGVEIHAFQPAGGDAILAILLERPGEQKLARALAAAAAALPTGTVPRQFFLAEKLPLRASGKVDVKVLEAAYEAGSLERMPLPDDGG